MILTEQQQKEFETVARSMVKWLNKNCHPHPPVTVIIGRSRAELVEGVYSVERIFDEFGGLFK